jgi:hypothetical protein
MKKKLIDAFDIHQAIVRAFHLSEDGLPMPRLILCHVVQSAA